MTQEKQEKYKTALIGKRLAYGNANDPCKGVITEIKKKEGSGGMIISFHNSNETIYVEYYTINELIATGESVDIFGDPITLLEDEPNTALNVTTTSNPTTTSGDIVCSDGIDWEGRMWGVFRHLYLVDEIDAETALENARGMVERYRKAMEGKV